MYECTECTECTSVLSVRVTSVLSDGEEKSRAPSVAGSQTNVRHLSVDE